MLVVGLTGGIAAGKTTVSHQLVSLGVPVIDCDLIAHSTSAKGSLGYNRIVAAFGTGILLSSGETLWLCISSCFMTYACTTLLAKCICAMHLGSSDVKGELEVDKLQQKSKHNCYVACGICRAWAPCCRLSVSLDWASLHVGQLAQTALHCAGSGGDAAALHLHIRRESQVVHCGCARCT